MARGANKKAAGGGGSDYLDNCFDDYDDLGGFASDTFENLNVHGGGFEGAAPSRQMGASELPKAGEGSADEALKAWGAMSRGRIDKTKSAPATLPTEAGGPLPQDALMYSETQRTKR